MLTEEEATRLARKCLIIGMVIGFINALLIRWLFLKMGE